MDSVLIYRDDVNRLSAKFSDFRHSLNNSLAVMMAMAEMTQKNVDHAPKLAAAVLERSNDAIKKLQAFTEEYNRLLRPEKLE